MKSLGAGALLFVALMSILAAQSTGRMDTTPHQTFSKYCVECHGETRPKAGISIATLIKQLTPTAVGEQADTWETIAEMLETRQMPPPDDAELFPSDEERAAAAGWVRSALREYESVHAGDPGRVTVRRLTSAEYGYAIRDLTGIDVQVGIDASSDAVGGEGFANFGDVQFVQDATVERYLEAAKQVAEHAVIGSGPLAFYTDTGKTGLELSALHRIEHAYTTRGFRVVSGEGGRPFGFDRYAKAFYVAWHYQHRARLGDPQATLRALAEKEGITARFAQHIWDAVNKPTLTYPSSMTIERWRKLPEPTADRDASMTAARTGCDALVKSLVAWPSWLFARGDLAAGGAGDESPLVFDDTTLGVVDTHTFTYPLFRRPPRPVPAPPPPTPAPTTTAAASPKPATSGAATPATAAAQPTVTPQGPPMPVPASGPFTIHLLVDPLHRADGSTPVVIWRNARLVLRVPPPPRDPNENAAAALRRPPGPVLASHSLRSLLPAGVVARLAFGRSPDGTEIGPDDFATTESTSFTIDVPAGKHVAEFSAYADLGRDRDAVMRVMVADRPEGTARIPGQRVFLGDAASAGYRAFRAGMTEYLALMPPNSHGEANPADKDPVPPPFDNTYNSPEHDAFVIKVKYQRNDQFFTTSMLDADERLRHEQAWTDLFGSWPYHDAYLGMLLDHFNVTNASRKIAEMTPTAIAALPADVRPHVRKLRAHYVEVTRAMKTAEPGHVTDALTFASRAWRRPLTTTERASLRAFYRNARTSLRLDHDAAIRALVARVLMSPAFLYRVEAAPAETETALNDWELASRLSFFLWSSIPDDELRRAAAAGELRDAAQVKRQVQRMTADPKARRLATEFFGQWLGFYHFDQYRGVDTGRFPEFTDDVRTSMYDEAISTFEYLVRENRPVTEILHADYAFLNKTLASFYGIDLPNASTGPVARVNNARAFDRGGALRLGSFLTTTSAPLRTSPVKRGDWILRRILSTPTPPPPADAGTLPADDKTFAGQTLRERLTQHKREPRCASCHLRIDPLGFPLEGFDAVGRARKTYTDGKPVDVIGEFRDKTTIVGADGLLTYLSSQEKKVLTTLSRKMLGYALGRNPHASDRRLILEMVGVGGHATISDLAGRLATSRQFRYRAGRADTAPSSESSSSRVDNP